MFSRKQNNMILIIIIINSICNEQQKAAVSTVFQPSAAQIKTIKYILVKYAFKWTGGHTVKKKKKKTLCKMSKAATGT